MRCKQVAVDYLSKQHQITHPGRGDIELQVVGVSGGPTVVKFSTFQNTLLPQFMSLIQDDWELAVDAFLQ